MRGKNPKGEFKNFLDRTQRLVNEATNLNAQIKNLYQTLNESVAQQEGLQLFRDYVPKLTQEKNELSQIIARSTSPQLKAMAPLVIQSIQKFDQTYRANATQALYTLITDVNGAISGMQQQQSQEQVETQEAAPQEVQNIPQQQIVGPGDAPQGEMMPDLQETVPQQVPQQAAEVASPQKSITQEQFNAVGRPIAQKGKFNMQYLKSFLDKLGIEITQ